MRTITTNVYTFNELSEDAKEKARDWFRSVDDYDFSEPMGSLEAFCDHYKVKITDYSIYAWCHSYIETDVSNQNFRGLKLKSVDPEYMPTGVCWDCDLWGTFHDQFKETGNALYAFNQAIKSFIKSVVSDIEYCSENEYLDDMLECNNYEFDVNGNHI